jgi:glutamyl-tRNA reductase
MLDSMIVGEQQILGQIKAAVMEAEDLGMMGPELRPLFARAIRAGRRARTETAISAGNVSMASVAVSLAEECVGTLLDAECMVIGAGKISRMIAKILVQKGATRIRITNRTDATAAQLAALTGATPIPFSQFRDNLPSCDVLFCASSAPHSLISEAVLREAMNERKRPLVIVDIAMPPDVEQGAMTIPGVLYYGLEEVRAYVRNAESSRIEEVPLVERIVEEEQHAYRNELYIRERKGAIRSISKYIEDIRLQELERLSARNEITSDDIDAFSRSVLKKAFHTLFQNFQDSSCPPELVHAARELILVPYKKRSE